MSMQHMSCVSAGGIRAKDVESAIREGFSLDDIEEEDEGGEENRFPLIPFLRLSCCSYEHNICVYFSFCLTVKLGNKLSWWKRKGEKKKKEKEEKATCYASLYPPLFYLHRASKDNFGRTSSFSFLQTWTRTKREYFRLSF